MIFAETYASVRTDAERKSVELALRREAEHSARTRLQAVGAGSARGACKAALSF